MNESYAIEKIKELEDDIIAYQERDDLHVVALEERDEQIRALTAQVQALMNAQRVDYKVA